MEGSTLSADFMEYLKTLGIQHELTIAHSPQQNEVAGA